MKLDQLNSKTLFINGDLIFSMDFTKLFEYHENLGSDITLVTHPSSHPEDSDMISAPNGSYVEKFLTDFSQITCPVQFHYGDNDAVAPMEGSVSVVQAACADRHDAEVFIYSGGEHSYMFRSRAGVYLEDAAELSWQRTFELLANL